MASAFPRGVDGWNTLLRKIKKRNKIICNKQKRLLLLPKLKKYGL